MKRRRNADLSAADFCRFASQGLRLGKSPLRLPAVAGLEQGLAVCQPSLATSSKRAVASSNGDLPALRGSSPGFHFPMSFLRLFFAAAKDFGWDGDTQKSALPLCTFLPMAISTEGQNILKTESTSTFS
jgi:hypothetical protein